MANFKQTESNQLASPKQTLAHLLDSANVRSRFERILGNKANGFISSIINTASSNPELKRIASENPESIIRSAAIAAALDLPVDKNLGFSWLVPYKGEAQFQMAARGFIQLGLRTAQYSKMTLVDVYENQFKSWNPITEVLDADFSIRGEGKIVGFVFYFRLINGFEKTAFAYKEDLTAHGKRYSKSFNNGPWQTHTDEMCRKTLVKQTLKQWGIMSIEMQTAVKADQAVVKSDNLDDANVFDYPDGENTIEAEATVQQDTQEAKQ